MLEDGLRIVLVHSRVYKVVSNLHMVCPLPLSDKLSSSKDSLASTRPMLLVPSTLEYYE
jgi:hypothetical protein